MQNSFILEKILDINVLRGSPQMSFSSTTSLSSSCGFVAMTALVVSQWWNVEIPGVSLDNEMKLKQKKGELIFSLHKGQVHQLIRTNICLILGSTHKERIPGSNEH